jgi:hypothetical protein
MGEGRKEKNRVKKKKDCDREFGFPFSYPNDSHSMRIKDLKIFLSLKTC